MNTIKLKQIWSLLLLLFCEGAALMAVELLSTKMLAPFFGNSIFVLASILCITSIGLSLGYFFGGRFISKKISSSKLVFIVLMAAFCILLMPYTSKFAIKISMNLSLIMGIIFSSIIIIIPPIILFGIVSPSAVKLIHVETNSSISNANFIYFISTIGGVFSTFLLGYYIIPEYGLIFTSKVTAILLTFVSMIYYVTVKIKSKEKTNIIPSENESINLAKSNFKINKSLYLFAILEGSAVMAVELMVARMLSPYFGANLFVWSVVLAVTLLSLAIGYYTGGKLNNAKQKNTIHWVALLASVSIFFLHVICIHWTNSDPDFEVPHQLILIALFLLFPPLFFLGMIPTILIKNLSIDTSIENEITGVIFALSAISGVLVLPILGFHVIPTYGVTNPSIFIAFIVGVFPFITLLKRKKILAIIFPISLLLSKALQETPNEGMNASVKYFSEGMLGQVMVVDVFKNALEQPTNDRLLFVNRMGQTNINNISQLSNWNYITFGNSIVSVLPEKSKVLLLGLGGGSFANSFYKNLGFSVDAVEFDERIVNVALDYFGLDRGVNVIVDDARHYLEVITKKYDLIFFDVFKGDVIPAHVLSLESFEQTKKILSESGMLVVNFNGFLHGKEGEAARSVLKTLKSAGFIVSILPTPGPESERNTLFVASKKPINFNSPRSPLLHNGQVVDLNSLFFKEKSVNLQPAFVLRDDVPMLEKLNISAGNSWRKGYNKGYSHFLKVNGIPLFK